MTEQLAQLEALIIGEGGTLPSKTICRVLHIDAPVLQQLVQQYNAMQRGTVLVYDGSTLTVRVAKKYAPLIAKLRTDEQHATLSKAALEVLSIILYSGKEALSASEIEHIRGVNSNYTLRQLTMRALVQKQRHGAEYRYAPTVELLSFLGVTQVQDLPEYAMVRQRISDFEQHYEQGEQAQ